VTCLPLFFWMWSSGIWFESYQWYNGRIGRSAYYSALYEKRLPRSIQVVAINELSDIETNQLSNALWHHAWPHFLTFYSTKRTTRLIIDDALRFLCFSMLLHRWNGLGHRSLSWVMVIECSGQFFSIAMVAQAILGCGVPRICLLSQPRSADVDATICYGFNHQGYPTT